MEYMNTSHKKRFHVYGAEEKHCVNMTTVLNTINRVHFDWWSLDVEGAELQVLYGTDLNRFSFSVITIESLNRPMNKIALYLGRHNYKWHSNDGFNDWFYRY